MDRALTPELFRGVVGRFATGVTVVATLLDDHPHATTVNAFASLSLDPLLVLVCLDRDSALRAFIERAGAFAVTVLGEGQRELSLRFSSPERPSGHEQFDGVPWRPAPTSGAPVLAGGVAWLDCRLQAVHPGGDHTIYVGAVTAMGEGEAAAPLVFYRGEYHGLTP